MRDWGSVIKTHEVEGNEFVLNGSKTCPHPELVDIRDGENYEAYVRRHAIDHQLGSHDSTPLEDVERNLGIYCGYFLHKYVIGNPTLTPYPFWETHEFVWNWEFHEADLEMSIWDEISPSSIEDCSFRLPPWDERKPGTYKRFKELEVPRGCQKTSIVGKAYVTARQLEAYFLERNDNFRVIITSATTSVTGKTVAGLKLIWDKNQNIKRLYGSWKEFRTKHIRRRRIGIYGHSGRGWIAARWVSNVEDSSGQAPFSVLYAGIGTETTGERADLYVFDDGSTKKNSKTDDQRLKVREAFMEQVKQLDPAGRMVVCNTRKHLDDFGGIIKTADYRRHFHILHRRAWWLDPKTSEKVFYYPVDGTGRVRYNEQTLDEMRALSTEHEFWSELMNWPQDPTKALFHTEDFQIVQPDAAPPEIRFGLGRELSTGEQKEMHDLRLSVIGYNLFDPAGKEEQSKRGDDCALIGTRVDRWGRIWITYIRFGQWSSTQIWQELDHANSYNRPLFTDYEVPASEHHLQNSFDSYLANRNAALVRKGLPPSRIPINFEGLPKTSKFSRIEQLQQWTKNKWFFILANAAEPETIRKFIRQFVDYGITTHDDGPDATSRIIRFLKAPEPKQIKELPPVESRPEMIDGKLRVKLAHVREAYEKSDKAVESEVNWGLRGGSGKKKESPLVAPTGGNFIRGEDPDAPPPAPPRRIEW